MKLKRKEHDLLNKTCLITESVRITNRGMVRYGNKADPTTLVRVLTLLTLELRDYLQTQLL